MSPGITGTGALDVAWDLVLAEGPERQLVQGRLQALPCGASQGLNVNLSRKFRHDVSDGIADPRNFGKSTGGDDAAERIARQGCRPRR